MANSRSSVPNGGSDHSAGVTPLLITRNKLARDSGSLCQTSRVGARQLSRRWRRQGCCCQEADLPFSDYRARLEDLPTHPHMKPSKSYSTDPSHFRRYRYRNQTNLLPELLDPRSSDMFARRNSGGVSHPSPNHRRRCNSGGRRLCRLRRRSRDDPACKTLTRVGLQHLNWSAGTSLSTYRHFPSPPKHSCCPKRAQVGQMGSTRRDQDARVRMKRP